LYEEWNWILGTGVYIDDIQEIVLKSFITDFLLMFLIYSILGIISFTLIFRELKVKEHFQKSLAENIVLLREDIEKRKRIEKELKETQSKLLQSQKMDALGRFAGGIAHDFNNLITVINGLCDIIMPTLEDNQQSVKEDLQDIHNAGDRAAELTRQILTFSRKQITQPKVINVNKSIRTMVNMVKRLLEENISISMDLAPDLENILIDVTQLEQVIMNLFVNARDAMPSGGSLIVETRNRYISAELFNSDINPGSYTQISISDTGIGMNESQLSHIFEPFFTTKEQGKGTGLGLSTVYGIVQQNEGEITVYSHLGRGTTFTVYFPQINSPASIISIPDTSMPDTLKGPETILMVEDDEFLRKYIRRVLISSDYTVLEAEDALQAIELSRNYSNEIHMLLTDVILPKMTGKELADLIVQERTSIIVLFMSGYSEKVIDIQGVVKEGFNFLHKSFSSNELLRKIKTTFLEEKYPDTA
jgi:signal transduction histidine kinase/ActR/RegA family two-component response regulator